MRKLKPTTVYRTIKTPMWYHYLLDRSLDLVIGGSLLKSNGQINNRNVNSWDTEGHSCQLSVKDWEHLANSLRKINKSKQDQYKGQHVRENYNGRSIRFRHINGVILFALYTLQCCRIVLTLAAPVLLGMMLKLAALPPLQSLLEGPSTVFWVAKEIKIHIHQTIFRER
jgi:hypothetical protein